MAWLLGRLGILLLFFVLKSKLNFKLVITYEIFFWKSKYTVVQYGFRLFVPMSYADVKGLGSSTRPNKVKLVYFTQNKSFLWKSEII